MNNQESHTKTLQKAIRKTALKKEADKFKQFLALSGISQTQAAELCYLTPRAIAYYLSGERPVPRWVPEFIELKIKIDTMGEEAWRNGSTIAMLGEKIRILCGGLP